MLAKAQASHRPVEAGRFGAGMKVTLTNDGPVTIWLRIDPRS
jgi:D-tyrosyl-tRNA(Tyr) deacylase